MSTRIHKFRLPVRISFLGETDALLGVVYVRQDQRIGDMLCDQRGFFPLETNEGLVIVNKAAISKVYVANRRTVEKNPGLFPNVDMTALDRRSGDSPALD